MTPLDPQLEGRVSLEGSELIIKKVQMADMGVFKVSDLAGFHVANIYVDVVGKGRRHLEFVKRQTVFKICSWRCKNMQTNTR